MADRDLPYSPAQINERLRQLPGWTHADGVIERAYETTGWPITLMLVNAIGLCAELANHHPDLTVSWGRVVVALSTHSAGGVTEKDCELAGRCDDVALWSPVSARQTPLVRGA